MLECSSSVPIARSIGFSEECLGLHYGNIHRADLGDGEGRKDEKFLARQYYFPVWGTCWESVAGELSLAYQSVISSFISARATLDLFPFLKGSLLYFFLTELLPVYLLLLHAGVPLSIAYQVNCLPNCWKGYSRVSSNNQSFYPFYFIHPIRPYSYRTSGSIHLIYFYTLGGNHFRAWRQNGTLANSGAWFLG